MQQTPAKGETNPPPQAEFRIGDRQGEQRQLAFKITSIHEKQKPTAEAPYHTKGGEWTFFDCQASSDPQVAFMVGVSAEIGEQNLHLAWGKAVLIVKDREAGIRFIELFGKVFAGKMPPVGKQAHVPKPLSVNTAILGSKMSREDLGGFTGMKGGWTATKWFPSYDGHEGEVYFNYNLEKRQGEFSEKDADYADELMAILASALRDGPRPERTPENDPNLTRIGPAIGKPRKLLSRLAANCSFSPKARLVVYQDRTVIFALPVDKMDVVPFEIARFDNSPWDVRVLDEALDLLVQEGISEQPGVKSSADPMRIWWVAGNRKEKTLLRGPEKDLSLAENPASPDHRYVALQQWNDAPGGKGRMKILYILDRQSGKASQVESEGKDLSLVGWKTIEAGLRGVTISNRWQLDKKETSELYLVDPSSGKLERQDTVDARLDIDNPRSPDGERRVRVGNDDLIVTTLNGDKKSRFVFHEDDRRYLGPECIEWVSPRYLKFNGPKLALIDVKTMKMCYPATNDGMNFSSHSYTFSSDFRWVLYQGDTGDGEGLFVAPVEMPKEP